MGRSVLGSARVPYPNPQDGDTGSEHQQRQTACLGGPGQHGRLAMTNRRCARDQRSARQFGLRNLC
ncbi:MAG: hypothetical protein LBV34_08565 [Nocardiopsaceae bacterium]|nr:hypothetical protein [Nocardiopsaceae bacterium]